MLKLSAQIDPNLSQIYEDYFYETGSQNWSIEQLVDFPDDMLLCGYFDGESEANSSLKELCEAFPELKEGDFTRTEIFKKDFQNEYKKYLSPYVCKNLHWVPIWLKDSYNGLKEGDKVFYFDAEGAFGTGDHATTRLCMARILDICEANGGTLKGKSLVDAGCGSGILALSSKLYGCDNAEGFDIESSAVQVANENAQRNGIECKDMFKVCGIKEGISSRKFDIVVANILANILEMNAQYLADAVKDGGSLILSGILAAENEHVRKVFWEASNGRAKKIDFRQMGDWSDVLLQF